MTTSAYSEPFTAALTASELVLLDAGGWLPVALVTGDCSYDPGTQITSWRDNQKLSRTSEGLARGHALALGRMRRQAAAAQAEGVVGVALTTLDLDIADDSQAHPSYHVSAAGTAVRRRAGAGPDSPRPFTSHLSGQDTWRLTTAGCAMRGVVFGFGAYHVRTALQRPDRCVEMPDLTAAVYDARRTAMADMRSQAVALGAGGVVGASIDLRVGPGPTVTFIAMGTAISPPPPGLDGPALQMVMRLND